MQSGMVYLVNGMGNGLAEGMMRGGPGGMHGGGFFLGGLSNILGTVVIVLLVLWVVRNWSKITDYASRTAASLKPSATPTASVQTPLEILQTRYAKGEINREEYESIRHDLVGESIPVQAAEATQA